MQTPRGARCPCGVRHESRLKVRSLQGTSSLQRSGLQGAARDDQTRRLSLDDTAKMSSLAFLNQCHVTELRLSLHSLEQEVTDAAGFPFSLSRLLRSNPRLRQLSIEARDTPQRQNEFAEGLATLSTLRHLCVLTESITTEHHVTSFFT
ncbi:hypothetical protein V5799_022318 [Amblyomma americanum]|uniref:Uncharacterized protein n=1 Tax=Amblyomma americanum TaxID=6943 RepID=A0AAQ4FLC8_AMBAM